MLLKLMAPLSGFIFIGIAAMFGTAIGNEARDFIHLVASIFIFVSATAFILGLVFGRPGFRGCVVAGCVALLLMSLPLEIYYGSDTSFTRYIGLLLMLFLVVACANLLGTRGHPAVASAFKKLAD